MLRVIRELTLIVCALVLAGAAHATAVKGNEIQHHRFHAGEAFLYDYDDTDISYCGTSKDGVTVAGEPKNIQQMKIPVKIAVFKSGGELSRKLTLAPSAEFREAPATVFTNAKFQTVSSLIKNFPVPFSYSYLDEYSALTHLFDLFKKTFNDPNFMSDPTSQFLFFKMQDVHQMQSSALALTEGLRPGESYVLPGRETSGLGGKFIGGPAQYLYVGVEKVNGVKAAHIRVTNLGNEFSTSDVTAYTNFTFSMYIALDGLNKGLLLSGEGQETAYPVMSSGNSQCPRPILQRQFSIRLR